MLPPKVCELKQNRDTVHSQVSRLHTSASIFVSLPDQKLLHILFCFSFKQLHPQGVWSLITDTHLPQPTGGRPRIRPATVPRPITQQQRRRCAHYSGSAATHKESATTAGIIAATPCLQQLSLPDEATEHHKRFCGDDCVTAAGWTAGQSQRGHNDSCLLLRSV